MIREETSYINGVQFTKTYSDEGRYVMRDGVAYEEAWDPTEFGRTYTEGELIPVEEETAVDPYADAGRIMMGVMP